MKVDQCVDSYIHTLTDRLITVVPLPSFWEQLRLMNKCIISYFKIVLYVQCNNAMFLFCNTFYCDISTDNTRPFYYLGFCPVSEQHLADLMLCNI